MTNISFYIDFYGLYWYIIDYIAELCDRALLAADRIKGQYNKFFAVYNDTLRDQLLREQVITDSMESALTEGQFTIYLQPKYSLNDDGLAGAEALVRWIHPEWGIISPGEFIPLFEKNGFITLLDQYVWEQVCVLLRDWREKGYATLPVSVNVSRADVYQSDLPDTLLGLVQKYGVDPGDLHLEITESAYTENPSQIISTVERLRRLGFIIEMDDFGSGYSSLNMLNQMKMDILKLDMKFIQTETAKPMEQGILRFVVGLARWMNLSVVAEGVETREQLERLREIGCDYVQGYFFARPMPCREYEDLLKTQIIEHRASAQKTAQTSDAVQSLLVVDEDAAYRRMIHQIFDGQYQILEASDAQGALDCVAIHGHDITFAVMLSMTLPDQGAALLLKELRQDPTLWRIPILATMPQSEELEKQALDLDADDFICKPHTQRGLRKRIAHLLSMTMHQERERVLQDEAYRDYLTGLLNRRGFHAAIDSLRQEDLPLAVYLFDVDDLKKINDNHGHGMGDEMLRFFGELLQRRTRDGDILCRYGGDEFVVILRHIDSVETILKKGREICLGFDDWRKPDGVHATCSCGIALCGPDEKPSVKLIERADTALYRVKQKDKGGCCLWEKQMEEST